MVSKDEKPWYSNGLAFECTQCGNCCSGPETGYVWVSDDEIVAMANAIGMGGDLDEFERKFTRRIGNRISLIEYSDGDCIFLDPKKRNCTLYDARPSQCRTWPFWRSNLDTPKDWKEIAQDCPGCNRGRLYTIDEIQATANRSPL